MTTTELKTIYMGRNIGQDDKGYYITFSDKDRNGVGMANSTAKSHYKTYQKASKQMSYMLEQGHTWFDAHFDPTI